MWTNQKTDRTREVEIDGMHVEMLLLGGKEKCLGQNITVVDQEATEIQHRIRCAWSAFAWHRQELTSQSCLLRHRPHLFEALVTPTVMYGAGTWTTKTKKTWIKDIRDAEISEDTEEKDSTHDEHDQDSISFDDDDDSTASQEVDLDDWIEYRRRSMKEVDAQKNIQWRQALRIAAQSQDTWARTAARQRLKGEQEDQPKYGKTI